MAHQAPLPTGFSRQESGVGCCFLLQGIFLAQRWGLSLLCLLHWQAGSLPLDHPGRQVFYNSGQFFSEDYFLGFLSAVSLQAQQLILKVQKQGNVTGGQLSMASSVMSNIAQLGYLHAFFYVASSKK